eukprot:4894144-Heterocapsa_arctica.AAC.1
MTTHSWPRAASMGRSQQSFMPTFSKRKKSGIAPCLFVSGAEAQSSERTLRTRTKCQNLPDGSPSRPLWSEESEESC